jgi:photosystem II stability/assembly factor-like uncharacterized protein
MPEPEFTMAKKMIMLEDSSILIGTFDGVYKSSDFGFSWRLMTEELIFWDIYGLDTDNLGTIYIGGNSITGEGKIYKSSDGGETWIRCDNGIPEIERILSLLVNDNNLFVGTVKNGIYRSEDSGNSWTRDSIYGFNNSQVLSLASIGDTLFAGIKNMGYVISQYSEAYWFAPYLQWNIGQVNCFEEVYGDSLLLGTFGEGVLRTRLKPLYDITTNVGMQSQIVNQFRIIDENLWIAATEGSQVMISADKGLSWERSSYRFESVYINTTINDPSDSYLYAGTSWDGVYKSTDRGVKWSRAGENIRDEYINCMILDVDGDILIGTRESAIFRSRDDGETWEGANEGLDTSISKNITALFKSSNNTMYAGLGQLGLFISRNNAESWEPTVFTTKSPSAITELEGVVYIAIGDEIFSSDNDGKSFFLAGRLDLYPEAYVNELKADNDGQIYAATSQHGLVKSMDNGKSWNRIEGFETYFNFKSIEFDGDNIYLASEGKGIIKYNPSTSADEESTNNSDNVSILLLNNQLAVVVKEMQLFDYTIKIYNYLGQTIFQASTSNGFINLGEISGKNLFEPCLLVISDSNNKIIGSRFQIITF